MVELAPGGSRRRWNRLCLGLRPWPGVRVGSDPGSDLGFGAGFGAGLVAVVFFVAPSDAPSGFWFIGTLSSTLLDSPAASPLSRLPLNKTQLPPYEDPGTLFNIEKGFGL